MAWACGARPSCTDGKFCRPGRVWADFALLLHHCAGLRGGGFQRRHGGLVAAKGGLQRLLKHGPDFRIIVYAKATTVGCRRGLIDRNQLLPLAQVLVVAVLGLLESLLGQGQEAGFLIPLRGTLGLCQKGQETRAGGVAILGVTGGYPQGRSTYKRIARLVGNLWVIRQAADREIKFFIVLEQI